MGSCGSSVVVDPESKRVSESINQYLKEEKKHSKVKLLLLGAGESGKSTIAKQMKIIHLNGYTDEERLRFRPIVFSNIVENIRALVEQAERFDLKLMEANQENASKVFTVDDDQFREINSKWIDSELTRVIQELWSDPAIQKTFLRASEFQLSDSTAYFFQELDRISKEDYVPSIQDILRVRVKTTGTNETEFRVDNYVFSITDVGGQRSERRKWIHCFENVTAIIFCAALSEYDQKLYEDETTNRMFEALRLFSDIVNSKWFVNTPVILFLNKKDIFESKIKEVPLKVCFKDYEGPNEYEEASDFIEKQFLGQIKNEKKLHYVYKSCATDTDNIKLIFQSVKDVFVTIYLEQMGLLTGRIMGADQENSMSR